MHFTPNQYIECIQPIEYMGACIHQDIKILKQHYGLPTVSKHVMFKYPNGNDIELVDITTVKFKGESYHHVGNGYYEKTCVKQSQYIDFIDLPLNMN